MVELLTLTRAAAAVRPPLPASHPPATDSGPPVVDSRARFDPLAMLLAESAAGNERAFARLYELTGARLLAVARGILGHADLAEDVLQDSFLRIWRSGHQYDPGKGSAYAWLVTIVRHRAFSAKVRLGKHDRGRSALDPETLVFGGPDPAAHAMRSEEARRVRACLGNLPVNHRKSVELVYFEGLTHRELALRLDVQLGTAKSWVRRGLAQMSRCLTGGADAGWRELVAAEYAVGSLQGTTRRGFERRRERDARYCRAADLWETRLALLTEFLPDDEPASAQVWIRIEQKIRNSRASAARSLLSEILAGVLVVALVLIVLVGTDVSYEFLHGLLQPAA